MPILHPLVSVFPWIRFLFGFSCIVVVPGYLLCARHTGLRSVLDRVLVSVAAGLLVVPVLATVLDTCGLPVAPAVYLGTVGLLAVGAGRWDAYRERVGRVDAWLGDAPGWSGAAVLAVGAAMAVVVVWGLGDLPVPPTVHDGANHAFMTLRIAQTSAYDPDIIFGPPWGRPDVPYLFGWHVTAALVARLAGLPPYVATWFLPLVCLFLLPAFWSQLWRAWGLTVPVVVTAAALVPANPAAPVGLLTWGGMGLVVGMALVPTVSLLLVLLVERPRVATALPAGIALFGLAHIHAGEVVLVLLVTAVTWLARRDDMRPGRWSPASVLALLAVLALLLLDEPWQAASAYRSHRLTAMPAIPYGISESLDYLWRAAGNAWGLKVLLLAGVVLALGNRRRRPIVAAAAVLSLLVIGLMVWRDPVTRLLALPFYAGWVRTRAALMIIAPVLVALPLAAALAEVRRRWPRLRWGAAGIIVGIILLLVQPGLWRDTRRNLVSRQVRDHTLFDDGAWRVARRLEEVVPAGAWVANSYDDGTAWGLHVGSRPHLVPCGWGLKPREGVDRNQGVVGLLERPWPALTRALAAHGVTHFFASNRYIGGKRTSDVETFGADDRFELVVRDGDFALYRVRWEAEDISVVLDQPAGD